MRSRLMQFGVCISNKIDETGIAAYAENLGYSHAWVTDTQMIFSDCWATLALVARQTRTIKIGTGVAIAPTRLAPVTANAIATINQLAPGRTFLGIGTGNTAMRLMGQPPMKIGEFAEYLRVVRGLLDGKRVDYTYQGRTAPIELMMREFGFYAIEPRIPMYVSGFGPRAMELAGEAGDGLVFSIPRVPTVADALQHVREGAARSARSLKDFHTCALTSVIVQELGEALNSDRIVREYGPGIMASVHYAYDKWMRAGGDPPPFMRSIWERYCALLKDVPLAIRHLRIHDSHYTYMREDEAALVTPELVRAVALAGTPTELVEIIGDLARQGLSQIMFLPSVVNQYRMVETFARQVMARL
ncbi:MAG: LLM class flavin-dependent oxidoreductase [Betaproteobacteria bacterium]|nr:LLM class flavin-dependent oxidoreductase [Betaproteobacteria bacterium]